MEKFLSVNNAIGGYSTVLLNDNALIKLARHAYDGAEVLDGTNLFKPA